MPVSEAFEGGADIARFSEKWSAAWVRFELTKDFRPWRFSRPLPSTARPPRLVRGKLRASNLLQQGETAASGVLDGNGLQLVGHVLAGVQRILQLIVQRLPP